MTTDLRATLEHVLERHRARNDEEKSCVYCMIQTFPCDAHRVARGMLVLVEAQERVTDSTRYVINHEVRAILEDALAHAAQELEDKAK